MAYIISNEKKNHKKHSQNNDPNVLESTSVDWEGRFGILLKVRGMGRKV